MKTFIDILRVVCISVAVTVGLLIAKQSVVPTESHVVTSTPIAPEIPTSTPPSSPTVIQTQKIYPTSIPTTKPVYALPTTAPVANSGYSCNCSKTCPQMSSCEEAYYQLNQCGCSIRDGDNDGVPCESIC